MLQYSIVPIDDDLDAYVVLTTQSRRNCIDVFRTDMSGVTILVTYPIKSLQQSPKQGKTLLESLKGYLGS